MSSASRDPDRNLLVAIILHVVEPLLRYARSYPASVVQQRDDGTLDLELVYRKTRIPDPSGVPIRGLPGVTVKVKPGTIVLLSFEHTDRARPVATLFSTDGLAELRITASTKVVLDAPEVDLTATASRGVSGEGDMLTFTGTIAGGGVVTGTATIASGSARVRI